MLDDYRRLSYENGFLGYPTSDEIALRGGALSIFQGGLVYWSPATGAHEVHGQVLDAYRRLGFENGFLGYPTSDEIALSGGALGRFAGGSVYWSPATGAHALSGALLDAYTSGGAERGALGYPTSEPYAAGGGTRVDFERGSLTLTASGSVVPAGVAGPGAASVAPTPEPAAPAADPVPAPESTGPAASTPAAVTTPATGTP